MCQHGFWQTHEFIAVNAAVMFESLVDSNGDLGGEVVISGIDGGANRCGETGINENLATDNDEYPEFLRIIRGWPSHTIQLAPFHSGT